MTTILGAGLTNIILSGEKAVKNVLDTRKAFVEAYWYRVKRGQNALSDVNLDKWDSDMAAEYREMTVAGSREELFLRATVEGLI